MLELDIYNSVGITWDLSKQWILLYEWSLNICSCRRLQFWKLNSENKQTQGYQKGNLQSWLVSTNNCLRFFLLLLYMYLLIVLF